MKKYGLFVFILAMLMVNIARADNDKIKASLAKIGLNIENITPSPIQGLKTVLTSEGIFYVTEDGQYILHTALFDISKGYPINLTNQLLMKELENLAGEMIVFKADKEKYVATVFTDISCGYCKKLQSEIAAYNAKGITIRYLAYPRAGMQSETAKEMKSVWCAKDRKKAFDQAAHDKKVVKADCNIDLSKHYEMGKMFNVTGTPAILVGDIVIPGYQNADELSEILKRYYSEQTQ